MPLYDYVCKNCSHAFEELGSSAALPACPKCAARDADRVPISRVAVGRADAPVQAGCGRCGDPRGPGACRMN
ncbi:MAG: zinc ribbon domain-containing protein [Myxococcales bacterium]|nr:zinc ribbon domain-containing protein [Myxococcales bacterium]